MNLPGAREHTVKSRIGFRRLAMLAAYGFIACAGIWLSTMAIIFIGPPGWPSYLLLAMGLAFCAGSVYGFMWDYRYVYSITIDEEKISISKRGTFFWNDLDSITLHTTKLVPGTRNIKPRYYSAIMINFKNEKAIFLFDIMYSNINEIRAFLEEHVINRKS